MKKIISILLVLVLCGTCVFQGFIVMASQTNDARQINAQTVKPYEETDESKVETSTISSFFAKIKEFFINLFKTIGAWFRVNLKKEEVKWQGKIYTDFSYGELESNKFDLYVPSDGTKENYGLIVYLHAGGFTSGDKSDDESILKEMCSKGFVAAGINYSLRDEQHPEVSVYSQSLEIKDSIPFVIEEAKKLGYSIDRMVIAGGSAGGCLALLYAYRDADSSPVPVKAVIEMSGPSSFHHEDWTSYGLDQNYEAAAGLFSVMSGNTITPEMIETNNYADAVKNISAYMWVNKNSVPTLCAYGKKDAICPFASAKHLVSALEENNVPHDYIEFPNSGHALLFDPIQQEELSLKIDEYLEKYLK